MRWRSILLLILLYIVYLLSGGAVFYALEFTNEDRTCKETIRAVEAVFGKFSNASSNSFNSTNQTLTRDDLRNLIQIISTASANGVKFDSDQQMSCAHNWLYQNALFFSGTVVTTIGYGNVSPRTRGGRVFCIFYAMVGIPLFAIMFSAIGDKMAKRFHALGNRLEKKIKKEKLRNALVITVTWAALLFFFCVIPAFIFSAVEKWTYQESFYYSFITLTTIGFGDFVVGTNPDQSYPSIYRIAVYFWILFGLAFMASMVSLASDFFKEAAPLKKRKTEDNKPTAKEGEQDESGYEKFETNDNESVIIQDVSNGCNSHDEKDTNSDELDKKSRVGDNPVVQAELNSNLEHSKF